MEGFTFKQMAFKNHSIENVFKVHIYFHKTDDTQPELYFSEECNNIGYTED